MTQPPGDPPAHPGYPGQPESQPYPPGPFPGAQVPDGPSSGGAPWGFPPEPRRNGLGLSAMILGIAGVALGIFAIGFIPAIIAVIFGAVGIRRVKRGVASNRGQAWTGLILGLVGVVFSVLVFVFLVNRYQHCEDKGYSRGSTAFDHCMRGDSGY